MLIGFIVVIVMILVIVGLMATGNSGGGTGVNQTKATKVVTEIGTLAQSLSFFKTTTGAGNFEGFDHGLGIKLLDGYTSNITVDETTLKVANFDVDGTAAKSISTGTKSQAVDSLTYVFSTNIADKTIGTTTYGKNTLLQISAVLGGTDTALNQAIGTTIASKLAGGNMMVDATAGVILDGTYTEKDVIVVVTK